MDHRVRRQPPRHARERRCEQRRRRDHAHRRRQHVLHHPRRRDRSRRSGRSEARDEPSSIVECRDVAVGYDGKPVLEQRRTSRSQRGEIVALLGGSGCGKSTLLRAITGLLPPLAGEVACSARTSTRSTTKRRARCSAATGMAFQQDALFGSMTVERQRRAAAARADEAARARSSREMVRMQARARRASPGSSTRAGAAVGRPAQARGARARVDPRSRAHLLRRAVGRPRSGGRRRASTRRCCRFRDVLGITIVIVTPRAREHPRDRRPRDHVRQRRMRRDGHVAELERSHDDDVYDFFHRVAPGMTRGRMTTEQADQVGVFALVIAALLARRAVRVRRASGSGSTAITTTSSFDDIGDRPRGRRRRLPQRHPGRQRRSASTIAPRRSPRGARRDRRSTRARRCTPTRTRTLSMAGLTGLKIDRSAAAAR